MRRVQIRPDPNSLTPYDPGRSCPHPRELGGESHRDTDGARSNRSLDAVAAAAAAIEGEIPPQNLATFANPKTLVAVVALRWMPSRAESWRWDRPSSVASAISTPWVRGCTPMPLIRR